MENIDNFKRQPYESGELRYKLKNANVFVSSSGYHFIDYIDPIEEISSEIDESKLTQEECSYIEQYLQSNSKRFDNQRDIVKSYFALSKLKVLDIGCGGGLFLAKLKAEGADVVGTELSDSRAQYAKTRHSIKIYKQPIESSFFKENYTHYFDVVTLWDVIEHVNYPLQTLISASKLLKEGGLLLIDTPCRDSFYHQIGALTYRITRGRYPTFLNSMYSDHCFGHKQIFSTKEMRVLFKYIGLQVICSTKFHELSFPYEFYLKKMIRSDLLVRLLVPFVTLFFSIFKIRNKMIVIGRNKH